MPTGNKRTNFVDKRHMPQQRVKDTFFDYLAEEIFETAHRVWGSRRGVFGEAVLQGDGTDRFKVSGLPVECLDGEGHVLVLTAADAEEVYLENTVGVTYYAGARHCSVPSGIQRNPRTGVLFYDLLEDRIGVAGVPDAVTQVGGSLTVRVDAVFEAGVSHAGRLVTVWLNSPRTTVEGVAVERDLVVAFEGGFNVVHTAGLLGQGAVSAVLTDYAVAATGITVRRNTDLRAADPVAFLGTVTGAGAGVEPTAFDTTDQIDVSSGLNPTLNMAYDGGPVGTPGSGRSISVDAGAVELNTSAVPGANDTGDEMHGQLRLSRLDSTDWMQGMLQLLAGDVSAVPIAALQPLKISTYVQQAEPATLSGSDLVTLTRSGVNLLHADVHTDPDVNVLLLEDCPQAGLYVIESLTADTVTVRTLEGVVPASWPAGTATARVLMPRFIIGGSHVCAGSQLAHWNGTVIALRDGFGGAADLRILPDGPEGKVRILTARVNPVTGRGEPRNAAFVEFYGGLGSPGARLQTGEWIGTVGGEENVHGKMGIDVRTQVIGTGAADKYALNVKPMSHSGYWGGKPSNRIVGLHTDASGAEVLRYEPCGRLADSHRFVERFDYLAGSTLPSNVWFQRDWVGGGTVWLNDESGGMAGHGGSAVIRTAGGAIGDGVELDGPALWILRASSPTVYRRLNFYARARIHIADTHAWYGLGVFHSLVTSDVLQFRYYHDTPAGNWEFHCRTAGGSDNFGLGPAPDLTGAYNNDLGWCDFYFTVDLSTNMLTFWMTGMTSPNAMNVKSGGLGATDWLDDRVAPFVICYQYGDTSMRGFEIDHIEVWDELVLSGPKE